MNFAESQKQKALKAMNLIRVEKCAWIKSKSFAWSGFHKVITAMSKARNEEMKLYVWLESRISTPEEKKCYEFLSEERIKLSKECEQDKDYFMKLKAWTKKVLFEKLSDDQKACINIELATAKSYSMPKYKKKRLMEIDQLSDVFAGQFSKNIRRGESDFGVHVKKLDGLKHLPLGMRKTAKEKAKNKGIKGWVFEASYDVEKKTTRNLKINKEAKKTLTEARKKVGMHGDGFDSNKNVLAKLSELKREIATLNGKKTYGDFAWETYVIKSPRKMKNFLMKLKKEVESKKYSISKADSNGYDSLITREVRAKEALFSLWNKWFGINVEIVKQHNYLPNSERLKLLRDGKVVGYISLDLDRRMGKPTHDGPFMVDLSSRYKNTNGMVVLPESFVIMSADKEKWSHDDVLSFFHEMGHALSHFSCDSDFINIAYSDIEQDALEWPSMFMQEWAWDPEVTKFLFGQGGANICKRVKKIECQRVLKYGIGLAGMDMSMHATRGSKEDNPEIWFDDVKLIAPGITKLLKNEWARWEHLIMMDGKYAGYLYGQKLAELMYKRIKLGDEVNKMIDLWNLVFKVGGRKYSVDTLNEWSPGIYKKALLLR